MEFTAQQIAQFVQGRVEGDENATVNTFAKIEEGKEGAISFLSNPKYTHYIYTLHHSTNTHLLPNDQPLLLPEHLQPKLFLWASELPSAQQSAWM